MLTDEQLKALEGDDVVIDLGDVDVGAAQETLINDLSGIDTITISGIDYSSMNTITLPSTTYTYGATVGGITTINNINSNSQWTTGTSGYAFTNPVTPNTVSIGKDGIDMAAGTDIKIDGKSLKEFMTKMEQRLAILVPDPTKLEKFEALKKAYEHYKTMESLCFDEPKEDEDEC